MCPTVDTDLICQQIGNRTEIITKNPSNTTNNIPPNVKTKSLYETPPISDHNGYLTYSMHGVRQTQLNLSIVDTIQTFKMCRLYGSVHYRSVKLFSRVKFFERMYRFPRYLKC